MPTIVSLRLRTKYNPSIDAPALGTVNHADDVDLDTLTPRARALAEAVAQMPGARKASGEILCHHRTLTRRDTTPNPEVWLTAEEMDQPARQTWACWDKYPTNSPMPAAQYLERQARKIPDDWVIVCASWIAGPKQEPVPSSEAGAADRYLIQDEVLQYMRARGRDMSISTWRSYVARDQAPKPDRRVGRTPQWAVETIDAFLAGAWRATA